MMKRKNGCTGQEAVRKTKVTSEDMTSEKLVQLNVTQKKMGLVKMKVSRHIVPCKAFDHVKIKC